MPSPLAHALFGLAVHVATAPADRIADRRRALVTIGGALAPDLSRPGLGLELRRADAEKYLL